MALLLTHAAQLLTLAGENRARRGPALAELGSVRDGAVLIDGDQILRAGATDAVARNLPAGLAPVEEHDCRGMLVTPGLVDAHTHVVFGSWRLDDYERRLAGEEYAAIAASGGGIGQSVRELRQASAGDLVQAVSARLRQMRAWGVTTVEIKSGYGLELAAERKSLSAAAQAAAAVSMDAPRTFLGAHAVPAESPRAAYLDEVCERMLPALALPGPAAPEFADAFCDPAGFTLAECRRVLMTAQGLGLKLKLHADQFAHTGGVGLAVELGAVSVDHLECSAPADAQRLARAETVAVLLPGASWFLARPYAPARALIAAGAAVAVASDCNPGTCPILSLPLIMSLACRGLGLSPAEVWTAVTINAAAALARAATCGSLAPGKRADLAIFSGGDYRAIPCAAGQNLCRGVVRAGRWLNLGEMP